MELAAGQQAYGTVSFPTGQGMQGVNVVVQRQQGGWRHPEPWYDVSSVTGYLFQQEAGNPVTGAGTGMAASMGSTDRQLEGYYGVGWIPDIDPPGSCNGPMQAVVYDGGDQSAVHRGALGGAVRDGERGAVGVRRER